MKNQKRFYKNAYVACDENQNYCVFLDTKRLETPGKKPIFFSLSSIAQEVCNDFNSQGEFIDLFSMPLVRLVYTAFDKLIPDSGLARERIISFVACDAILYRASSPKALVLRQLDCWDPVLEWILENFGIFFRCIQGITPVEQPASSLAILQECLRLNSDPLYLAALDRVTNLLGSALLAFACSYGFLSAEETWEAGHLDEKWQIEHWGQDDEALQKEKIRKKEFMASFFILNSFRLFLCFPKKLQ